MTWSVKIVNANGPQPKDQHGTDYWLACYQCKHGATYPYPGEGKPRGNGACRIQSIGMQCSSLLTCVDVGNDGHMASGVTVLNCNGFEAL